MKSWLLFVATVVAQTPADTQANAARIANATQFNLTFTDGRVSNCTVTATSGDPQVDMHVCQAGQICGNKYHNEQAMAPCMAKKREELAGKIAKQIDQAK